MTTDTQTVAGPDHPSPYRHRVSTAAQLFGVFGGPFAWAIQLSANFALASHSCFPRDMPHAHVAAGSEWAWGAILAINISALLLALVATGVSRQGWSKTRAEDPGSSHHAIEIGEGRARFLALCGMMTGLGFAGAILLNTIALFMVPQCSG